jgi:hypothetical protein
MLPSSLSRKSLHRKASRLAEHYPAVRMTLSSGFTTMSPSPAELRAARILVGHDIAALKS